MIKSAPENLGTSDAEWALFLPVTSPREWRPLPLSNEAISPRNTLDSGPLEIRFSSDISVISVLLFA